MARNVTLKNNDGEVLFPKTSAARVEGLDEAIAGKLSDYVSYDELDAEFESKNRNLLDKTTASQTYATKDDLKVTVSIDQFDNFAKYGIFKVNGVPTTDAEIVLEVGKTYELSGYLNGHIKVYSPTGGDKITGTAELDIAAANTQIILNGVYVNSDTPEAIYCNQKSKKLLITYKNNNVLISKQTPEYAGTYTDSPAVVEVDNALYFIGDTNATLRIETDYDGVHAIKAQELFMEGNGEITVKAIHDGFHGTNILRADSGKYVVEYGKDAFGTGNGGLLQILGGEYNIIQCYETGFDAKGRGIIIGADTKIKFGSCGDGLIGSKVFVIDNVPTINGWYGTRTTLADFYGSGHVYSGSTADLTEAEVLAYTTEVLPNADGEYVVNTKNAWVTGYIDKPIKMTFQSCDLYFKNACIDVENDTAAVIYTVGSKKLACRGVEDSVNIIRNTGSGDAIWSGANCSLQGDGSFLISAENGIGVDCSGNTAWGTASHHMGTFQTKGDGSRIIYNCGKYGATGSKMHFGADDKLTATIADFYGQSMIFKNNKIDMFITPDPSDASEGKRTGYIFIYLGQLGYVVYDKYSGTNAVAYEEFAKYKDSSYNELQTYNQTENSFVIVNTKLVYTEKTNRELDTLISNLMQQIEKLNEKIANLEAGNTDDSTGVQIEVDEETGYLSIAGDVEVDEEGYLVANGTVDEDGYITLAKKTASSEEPGDVLDDGTLIL